MQCKKDQTLSHLWEETQEQNSFNEVDFDSEIKSFTVKSGNIVEAPMTLPLSVIKTDTEIWFCVMNPNIEKPASQHSKSITDVLMSKKLIKAERIKEITKKDSLYNDVVELTIQGDIRFRNSPKPLLKSVTECLWLIDCCHGEINATFAEKKCNQLPAFFGSIYTKQYNMWKEKKKPKPFLSYEKLCPASDSLFEIACATKNKECQLFIDKCRDLADCLQSYGDYLNKTKLRMAKVRSRGDHEKSDCYTLANIIPASKNVPEQYKLLDEQLSNFCLLYTSPSPRDATLSRMPSSA